MHDGTSPSRRGRLQVLRVFDRPMTVVGVYRRRSTSRRHRYLVPATAIAAISDEPLGNNNRAIGLLETRCHSARSACRDDVNRETTGASVSQSNTARALP